MEIYINGRFLMQRVTGVQRFALEIIKQLNKENDFKFVLLVPKNYKAMHELKHIEIRKVGNFEGHLWEQIDLVKYVKRKPLINLCNTAPILKKNQIVVIHDAAVYNSPKGFSFLFRNWYKIMFSFISKRTTRILTISDFSTRELIKYLHVDKEK